MKTAIIVVGPPRSGTSVVSHVLNKLGVDFGDPSRFVDPELNSHNPIFFELVSLNEINDEIFSHFSKRWGNFDWVPEKSDFDEECISLFENKISNFIEKEFSNKEIIGLKDPRFCYTLPLWDSILGRLGFRVSYVLVRRSASSIFISNKLVNKQSPANNFRLVTQSSLLAGYFLEGRNFLTVNYDNMLESPETSVRHICNNFEFSPSLIKDACAVISANLYHQKKTPVTPPFFYFANVIDSSLTSPEEYRRYREIYTSATFEKDQQIAGLRQAVSDRDQALAASSTQIAGLSQGVTEHDRQVAERDQVMAERDQALSVGSTQIASLGQGITERDRQTAELNQVMAERDKALSAGSTQIASLSQGITERDRQIAELNQVMAERDQALSAGSTQIASLGQGIAERDRQITELNQVMAELEGNIREYKTRLSYRLTNSFGNIRNKIEKIYLRISG